MTHSKLTLVDDDHSCQCMAKDVNLKSQLSNTRHEATWFFQFLMHEPDR